MTQTVIRGNWPDAPAPRGKNLNMIRKPHPNPVRGIAVKNGPLVTKLLNGEVVLTENLQRGRALKASVSRVLQHRGLDKKLWPSLKQHDRGCDVWLRERT